MKKLLIVDDDPAVLKFVSTVAESLDYEVLRANDGLEALIAYAEGPGIDALVTDIRMPGVNGFQLAHSIREKNPDIPILFISGYSDGSEVKSEMRTQGGIHFLPKPFTPLQLSTVLLLLFSDLLD